MYTSKNNQNRDHSEDSGSVDPIEVMQFKMFSSDKVYLFKLLIKNAIRSV